MIRHLLHRKIVTIALAALLAGLLLMPETGSAQLEENDEERYAKDASTEINVKDADIAAIVRIFSKKTKRNYILDERVKGKVSIYLPGKVSSDEAIRILDSVLALKNFTAVPIGKNLWKIIPAREAKQTTIPTVSDTDGRGSPSIVTRMVNLKYVTADDVKQLLTPLISSDGLLNAYTGTNSLIMIDSEENIKRLFKIVESLDIPFTDREMVIIPIEHAEAADLAQKINDILSEEEGGKSASADQNLDFVRAKLRESASGRTPPVPGQTAGLGAASTVTVSARSRAPKIIADERTNSVIVVADEETIAKIRALLSQLDSPVDLSGTRFYVYRCQHASAEEVAEVLSGLTGSGTSSSGTRGFGSGTSTNPLERDRNTGSRERGQRVERTQDRLSSQRRTPGRSRSENAAGNGGVKSVQFGEDLSITADPATNSLIISANRADYEKILDLLKQLDVKRRQVLVEAILMEVGIQDKASMGTEWIVSSGGADGGVIGINNYNNLADLFSNPAALSQFTVAAASSGTLTLPGGVVIPSQTVMLRAASEAQNVNVLSAPNILATDNEDAEIVVGQNVPFLSSTASSEQNLNNTFNQIDRQDVGITLRLTPQISSRNFVTLRIFTEVSNVIAATLGSNLGPATTIRTSETTVIAKDGQMVVIGGLIADDVSESDVGIPFMKDIPVLGHLFKEKSHSEDKTNLLIFITPRIIKDQYDLRDQTVDSRDQMQDFMDYQEVQPPRTNVLRDQDIDDVTEITDFDGEKPGTIYPTKTVDNAQKARRASLAPTKPSDSKITVKVSPRLPNAEDLKEPLEERDLLEPAQAEQRSEVSLSEPASSSSGGQFVVLQASNPGKMPANLPFRLSQDSSMFGIVLPGESNRKAKSFFKAGSACRYNIDNNAVNFKVLGVFANPSEAQDFFPDLADNWHTLSPYEIMNIGSGPWS